VFYYNNNNIFRLIIKLDTNAERYSQYDDSKLLQKSNLTAAATQGAPSRSTSYLTLLPPSE